MIAKKQIPFSSLQIVRDQKMGALREDAKTKLLHFTKFTKRNYAINWHHKLTCRALRKWMAGEIPNLIISQPPRHGKSEIASLRLPAFILGQNPDARIIATAYGDSLASKNNRSVQRIIDSQGYQQVFPGTSLNHNAVRSVASGNYLRNSDEFEIVGRLGGYKSAGIGGAITGMGADYLIIDDPIKNNKEADSEVYREAVWEWWIATALTRLEKHSRCLLIMTRWHEDDLAGRLLAQSKADPGALQWHELKFEAIREDMSNSEDPREFGDPLWPDKYSLQRLEMLRRSLGPRWFNALYQQQPSALEGGTIKKSWIEDNYYTEIPETFDRYLLSMDATFSKSNTSDWVVIQIWAQKGRFKYLLAQVRERMTFVESCTAVKSILKTYPMVHRKLIEKKANGDAIINQLQEEGISGVVGYNPTESKSSRLSAVSSGFSAGDVRYPHPSIAPWVQNNIDEIVKFPNAKHDDTVDATTQALIDLGGANWIDDLITM